HASSPCSGCACLELLAHQVTGTDRLVARWVPGSRASGQTGDLGIVVGMQEIPDRHPPAARALLDRRIDNAMQIRQPAIIGPTLHHVADVDDKLTALGSHIQPGAVPELYLQATGCITDGKNGQTAEISVLTRSDLVGE